MFKKKCQSCGEKTNKKFEFCPFCGTSMKKRQNKEEDYGMLGKDDNFREAGNMLGLPSGGMLNKMLGKAMKMLEKEMREMQGISKQGMPKQGKPQPKTNFQLYINGKKVNISNSEQAIPNPHPQQIVKDTGKNMQFPMPSEKIIEKAKKLPRKEAKTELKRLANKVVYEIEAPGTDSMNKILINQLEDGIEVRIFTKSKVLTKTISINLPLIRYYLRKQKLFLEFQGK